MNEKTFNGELYKAIVTEEHGSCVGCAFADHSDCLDFKSAPGGNAKCMAIYRDDGREVIWIKSE